MADIQSINLLWGYCFRAAHPRKPSWQHRCLCSVRRDFTVHHISEHLSGLFILETASGYRWVITNGMELNKTRSTGVNPAYFIALKKEKHREFWIVFGIWRETLAIYQNTSEFIELNTVQNYICPSSHISVEVSSTSAFENTKVALINISLQYQSAAWLCVMWNHRLWSQTQTES